ncbi:MAG TPA: Nif3-like dinuclear metal center hexameric protein [Ktedonobacterales bacterium]|nr:Nif3-like dinuclear metal center hexameric protein [Ktedonobacterales bacterium]
MLETIMTLAQLFRAQRHELYMVGGCVRDLLMQREGSPDIDLTTDARPDAIKRIVAATHPLAVTTVGETFGTIAVHYPLPESAAPAEPPAEERREPVFSSLLGNHPTDVDVIEITTYRSDVYHPDSRKPEVTFGDTLEGDLLRRDFTINAMARDPLSGEIVDPWGGRADLERKLIRAVGDDPHRRFDEDPLRMLRAVRFAAQLGFEIEHATAEAIRRQAATLGKISNERIRDELSKALTSSRPDLALRLLVNLGLAPYALPELLELRGVSQAPAHSKDVYEHVLRVVSGTPPRPGLRWAALLHDIAKPRTYSVENGKVHFFGHEDVGAVMAREILRRLRFDRPFIEFVSKLVRMHMRANSYLPDWTDGAVRRLMLEAGDALPDLLDLSRADITSYRPEKVARAVARINEMEARCAWLRQQAEVTPIKSPLDGNDLMALFKREPGPWLRVVKDRLLGLVIDGELAPDDRERAEHIARETLAELDAAPQTHGEAGRDAQSAPQPLPSAGAASSSAAPNTPSEPTTKREARAASRRKSRGALPARPTSAPSNESPRRPSRPQATTRASAAPRRSPPNHPEPARANADPPPARVAQRDAIVSFLDDYLSIGKFHDICPNGMQVIGGPEVRRVALGVSANLELIEQAARAGANMLICHHGLFIDRDPHTILARQKRRLKALFDADITLLGYHLPLDAHPEIGNNTLWLRRLGFTVESLDFAAYHGQAIGAIGARERPIPFAQLVEQIGALAGAAPRVYHEGPDQVSRLAVATGAAPGNLAEAAARGCDAYLTGETAEGTQALAREERANFIAAGHYNTERLGVQALGDLLQERFGVETFFIEVANDV